MNLDDLTPNKGGVATLSLWKKPKTTKKSNKNNNKIKLRGGTVAVTTTDETMYVFFFLFFVFFFFLFFLLFINYSIFFVCFVCFYFFILIESFDLSLCFNFTCRYFTVLSAGSPRQSPFVGMRINFQISSLKSKLPFLVSFFIFYLSFIFLSFLSFLLFRYKCINYIFG
jgi:hypothetical protein